MLALSTEPWQRSQLRQRCGWSLIQHTDGTAGDTGRDLCSPSFKGIDGIFLSHGSNLGGNRGKVCGPAGLLAVRVLPCLQERSFDPSHGPILLIALSINTYL